MKKQVCQGVATCPYDPLVPLAWGGYIKSLRRTEDLNTLHRQMSSLKSRIIGTPEYKLKLELNSIECSNEFKRFARREGNRYSYYFYPFQMGEEDTLKYRTISLHRQLLNELGYIRRPGHAKYDNQPAVKEINAAKHRRRLAFVIIKAMIRDYNQAFEATRKHSKAIRTMTRNYVEVIDIFRKEGLNGIWLKFRRGLKRSRQHTTAFTTDTVNEIIRTLYPSLSLSKIIRTPLKKIAQQP